VYTGQDCCKTQHFRLTRLLRNLHCALPPTSVVLVQNDMGRGIYESVAPRIWGLIFPLVLLIFRLYSNIVTASPR